MASPEIFHYYNTIRKFPDLLLGVGYWNETIDLLEIDDEPGKNSKRKFIERNSIALLSNCWETNKIDPASHTWLGNYCAPEFVRLSGMWNQDHVIEKCHPDFLEELDKLVK